MEQISQLFLEYYPKFTRFASSYLNDETAAEDVVMDSFMYFIQNKKTMSPVNNLPAYLLTIIKNKCLNTLRDKKTRLTAKDNLSQHNQTLFEASIASLEACDPLELFSEEVVQMVEKAIRSLPERTRTIFIKNRFKEMSYKEIAEEMHLSVKTIEKEISKALKFLRIALKDYITALLFFEFFM